MNIHEMISKHPDVRGSTADNLIKCIEDCYDCAATCTSCADACLAEDAVADLRQCIRLNLDCADLCIASASMASRRAGRNVEVLRATLGALETACRTCGEECRRHQDKHEHCRICAEACERCAQSCKDAMPDVH